MIITYNEKSKKFLKNSLIIIAIILFIFLIGLTILKYEVEGENIENLPFKINEIKIASKIDATKNEDMDNYWNLNLIEINDIYINIEAKNEKINSVKIQDIKIEKKSEGNYKTIRLYDKYNGENLQEICYIGGQTTDLDNMTISRQGGIIGFRYIIENIANYISNDEEITYNMELLQKAGLTQEQLQTIYSFILVIEPESGIKYATNISVECPTKRQNIENIDISKIIFKRILQN